MAANARAGCNLTLQSALIVGQNGHARHALAPATLWVHRWRLKFRSPK